MRVELNIIAVIGKNRELGKGNKLLWHIPEDMKHFKRLTLHSSVIMGRKTFESLKKPLPQRFNIIITRDLRYKLSTDYQDRAIVVHSFQKALSVAEEYGQKIFVIGGGEVYKQAIKKAKRLYLTLVDASAPADTFFPKFKDSFSMVSQRKSSYKNLNYAFTIFEKKD